MSVNIIKIGESSIENVKSILKGKVIIIGEKYEKPVLKLKSSKKRIVEPQYKVDGVLVYDSYCLCRINDNPVLIQDVNLDLSTEDVVYLCGHGSKEQKISGYSMDNIAKMLVENCKLSSNTNLYIVSCHGLHKNIEGDSMATLLEKSLINKNLTGITVEALAEDTTIVVDYQDKTYLVDTKQNSIFNSIQYLYLKKYGCSDVIVDINNYSSVFKQVYDDYGFLVAINNFSSLK